MIDVNIEKRLKGYSGAGTLKVKHKFAAGSVTTIHGPSGAGKTTFLKIVAGLVQADAGMITANNVTWLDTGNKINLSSQARRVGFVFQDYALFPNMSVMQHMQFATTDKPWIDKLLHLGKLETLTIHKPHQLSGGQQQRLAIIRALAIKPQIILMDEPFSALDKAMKAELMDDLGSIFSALCATVLIVSHNPDELVSIVNEELYIAGV
ncbi:ATP-binding cassette domain-containing protein [Mucilaginibacter calamicampi]|uniref:ATP-binding cassette domain-containing protein n=1 Tax=Mucilaginibacter calamicampi TaxID=1302352 RepID=A0ABW2Z3C5_9SPHI